jgi:hypothetical protein
VLVDFLRANADIFAWSPSDMLGIPREVAEHSLDILPHSRAVQQRLRRSQVGWNTSLMNPASRSFRSSTPITRCRFSSCISKEKEWEVADVCRLH